MTNQEIKKLASEVIGDGKEPNMFFVTTGPYILEFNNDYEGEFQLLDGYDDSYSESHVFNTFEEAEKFFDEVELDPYEGVAQVMLEDRKTGVIKDKYLEKVIKIEYSYGGSDDSKYFGYK